MRGGKVVFGAMDILAVVFESDIRFDAELGDLFVEALPPVSANYNRQK